ncbi:hypothetical protein ACFWN2_06065 [Lentzea sp. NPDC058436]|uniref:hypothetical protein n=1 Tax=Lentzea sp. NPDC058436 TaxID=3346499 RepID=UPI003646ADDE
MPKEVGQISKDERKLDVTSSEHLIGYATQALMRRLKEEGRVTQGRIGVQIGIPDDATFTKKLNEGLAGDELLKLDREMIKLDLQNSVNGGLSSLALRLRSEKAPVQEVLPVPPQSWAWDLLNTSPPDEYGVLMQGSQLLDMFRNSSQAFDDTARFKEIVERLIMIGAQPPTPRNVEALLLLGSIAGHAFDRMQSWLDDILRNMPLGFRVWRAITAVIAMQDAREDPVTISTWVRAHLGEAEQLREMSVFPARSLDLEAAIAVPPAWTARRDWVRPVLLARARNERAVVRERGTAAHGLWERAFRDEASPSVELRSTMSELVREFTLEAGHCDDPVPGMAWVAGTLRYLTEEGIPVCQTWSGVDNPCVGVVAEATAQLRVDPRIDGKTMKRDFPPIESTCVLFEHSLLQNAGVHRRNVIDTLLAAGMAAPVTEALEHVLEHEDSEAWLRCRALFAFGMLQERSSMVQLILGHAFDQSWRRFKSKPARTSTSELHAAMFAIGDCFGAPGAERQAIALRQAIDPVLPELFELTGHGEKTYMAARAAAYMLMVTAHAEPENTRRLLAMLERHPDRATKRLSSWALEHRFTSSGRTRPLHAAFVMPR